MRSAWYVLGALTVICAFNMIDRYLLAGLVGPIKHEFGVSDTYIGFLLGPSFAILYTTVAIPIARLADRSSRVRIISLGCAVWSLFTILSGLANDSTTFALLRLGVGLGEAAFVAPAYSLLADYFPPRRRALAFAIMGTGYFIGQFAGLTAGAGIAEVYGWRAAFIAMGVPGIVLAAIFFVTAREPARLQSPLALKTAQAPLWVAVRQLVARPSYRLLTIGSSFGSFATYAFAMWGPTYFMRVYEMSMSRANFYFAVFYGFSCMIGTLTCGWLSDRAARRGVAAPMRVAAAALFSLVVCLILVALLPQVGVAVTVMAIGGVAGGGYSAAVVASMHDLVPQGIRATATAIWSFVFNFVGFVWGPYAVGVLSDAFSDRGPDALRIALVCTSSVGLLGAFLLLRSSYTLAEDETRLAMASPNEAPSF